VSKVHRFLTKYQISLLFILGGDGTHRGHTRYTNFVENIC
jgi:6-phosphofructokinase